MVLPEVDLARRKCFELHTSAESSLTTPKTHRTVPGYSDTATAGVFCTYPQPFMTRTGMFFSEVVASTILVFCIFALKDDGNIGAGNLTPICLFFLIFGIGATLGWETGYAINLARDFGPRLFTCEDS